MATTTQTTWITGHDLTAVLTDGDVAGSATYSHQGKRWYVQDDRNGTFLGWHTERVDAEKLLAGI